MDSHTKEAIEIKERIRQRSEEVLPYDPEAEFRDRVRLKYFYQEAMGYKNYLSYISDLGNDLASKNDYMMVIEWLIGPLIIVLCLVKNYKTVAAFTHVITTFLQVYVQKGSGGGEYYLGISFRLPDGWLSYIDIIAPLLISIPNQYIHRLLRTVRRIILFNIMRRECADPQLAFIDACKNGNKAAMKDILDRFGSQINVNGRIGQSGDTALHIACRLGHLSIVQSLLDCQDKNVKLNIQNNRGDTPLTVSVGTGHKVMIKKILKSKNMKLTGEQVERAVLVATNEENYECAKIILAQYKIQEGTVFNSMLETYINRVQEGIRKKDIKSVDVYKRAIVAWFIARNSANTAAQKMNTKKTKEEIWLNFKEHFECTICFEEFYGGQIYSCESDHWICVTCKDKWIMNCPTCRVDFSENGPVRRHKAEKVLEDFAALQKIMEENLHNA